MVAYSGNSEDSSPCSDVIFDEPIGTHEVSPPPDDTLQPHSMDSDHSASGKCGVTH